jgi:hypothetical protein
MKKLFFSAALVVAFSLTSFAAEKVELNNAEVKIESESTIRIQENSTYVINSDASGSCTVIITAYNSDGIAVGSRIHSLPADSQSDCDKIGDQILMLYQIGALKM